MMRHFATFKSSDMVRSLSMHVASAGMLKSFLGVSASLASSIYVASFQPDGLGFLLFVALLPVAIGIATVPFMNYVPYVETSEVEAGHKYLSTGARRSLTGLSRACCGSSGPSLSIGCKAHTQCCARWQVRGGLCGRVPDCDLSAGDRARH